MSDEYKLVLSGFKTKEQVKEFISWYEGQGEQDAAPWFESCKEKGKLNVDLMPVDVNIPYVWIDNELHAKLQIPTNPN